MYHPSMLPRVLGLVPARGGSKGVPRKNVRLLWGRPLLVHTLEAARGAGCLDRLVVSTDDQAIAQVAEGAGVPVPWLRSRELAEDRSNVVDAALEALDKLEGSEGYRPEAVCLLQPTSPFRTVQTIRRAVDLFASSGGESVVSVSPARDHPYWCKRVNADGTLSDFVAGADVPVSRQELPPVFRVNGAVYVATVDTLRSARSFHSRRTRALVIDEREALDIDTPLDWEIASGLSFEGGSRDE